MVTGTADGAAHLAPDELERIDAYWRAANYLSVGQIYARGDQLLAEGAFEFVP